PVSVKSTSIQPVKRFSRFHWLSPWRIRTSLCMINTTKKLKFAVHFIIVGFSPFFAGLFGTYRGLFLRTNQYPSCSRSRDRSRCAGTALFLEKRRQIRERAAGRAAGQPKTSHFRRYPQS